MHWLKQTIFGDQLLVRAKLTSMEIATTARRCRQCRVCAAALWTAGLLAAAGPTADRGQRAPMPASAGRSAPCALLSLLSLRGGDGRSEPEGRRRRTRSGSTDAEDGGGWKRARVQDAPAAPEADGGAPDESSWDVWPEERKACPDPVLSDTGPGAKMMKKMGFEGGGLGSAGTGIREPVAADLPAAGQAAGREGIGLRPGAAGPATAEREALFSDSSDVADTKTFGSGNARQAQRAWDRKLRRAMGQPTLKPGRRQRKPPTVAGLRERERERESCECVVCMCVCVCSASV